MAKKTPFLSKPRNQTILFIAIVAISYTFLARYGRFAWDIVVHENLAYVANGEAGLRILDVSNANQPVEVGFYNSKGDARALFLEDSLIYLADGRAGLQIVDVQDPTAPLVLSSFDIQGFAEDVVVTNGVAYVAGRRAGLKIIDVRQPEFPRPVSSLDADVSRVSVRGDFLFLVENDEDITVFNIKNPERPVRRSTFNMNSTVTDLTFFREFIFVSAGKRGLVVLDSTDPDQLEQISEIKVEGNANGVTIADVYGYIVSEKGLSVWDLTDVLAIRQVGYADTSWEGVRIQVSDSVAYVAAGKDGLVTMGVQVNLEPELLAASNVAMNAEDVSFNNGIAYVASGEGGLRVVNVSNPSLPRQVSAFETSGYAMGVTTWGNLAFLAAMEQGLVVIDISNPNNVRTRVSTGKVGGNSFDVEVSSNYAYLADGVNGMLVVNVTDPTNPRQEGVLSIPGGNTVSLEILGNYAYVTAEQEGLQVVEISNPSAPVLLGAFRAAGNANAVSLVPVNDELAGETGGDRYDADLSQPGTRIYAYVAYGSSGLQVLDVTNPSAPNFVGSLEVGGVALDVVAERDRAYVAVDVGQVQVVDISNPSNPVTLGIVNTPGQSHGLEVDSQYIYVADYDRGLRVIDATNPSLPNEVGFYDSPGAIVHVDVRGNSIFSVDGLTGMWVLNAVDPNNPVETSYVDTPGQPGYVSAVDLAYVATGNDGLYVYSLADPSSITPVGSIDTPGFANSAYTSGNLVYVPDGDFGLRIIDRTNITDMREIGSLNTLGNARRVDVLNGIAYIACVEGGLEIAQVANPRIPVRLSNYSKLTDVRSVDVSSGIAFLAAGKDGFAVLDVTEPESPRAVYTETVPTLVEDVYVDGIYAFLAGGSEGIRIMDISNPENPILVGESQEAQDAVSITARWNSPTQEQPELDGYLIFVADNTSGLKIFLAGKSVNLIPLGSAIARSIAATLLIGLIDVFLFGVLGVYLWLAMFSQFVLPVSIFQDRRLAFDRLTKYLTGQHGPAVFVKNGEIIQHVGETLRRGAGVAMVDLSSAVVLQKRAAATLKIVRQATRPIKIVQRPIQRRLAKQKPKPKDPPVRVEGPGIVFTRHSVRGVVDLRPQIRVRPSVKAYTRDGIEVFTNIFTIFTLGEPPEVLKVTYIGDELPENLRVIHLKDERNPGDGRLPEMVKVVADFGDELDDDDKDEIHRTVQYYPQVAQPEPDAPMEDERYAAAPFLFDREHIFAAVFAEALDVEDKETVDWMELPPHVAAEVFRNMLMNEDYDYLYSIRNPDIWPIGELKAKFSQRVRNLGVLSFQFVTRGENEPLVPGQIWDEDELNLHPVRDLKSPKILRTRGIKVIKAGFSELKPVEEIEADVRSRMISFWRSGWRAEAEKIKAEWDIAARELYNKEYARVQRTMVNELQRILDQPLPDEALALRVYQALESAATDPVTRRMLPADTISMLRNFNYWFGKEN